MPPRLTLEGRETLSYLRRRVKDGMVETRGSVTGLVIFRQQFGTLNQITGNFQRFLNLSGRHIEVVAERIRRLAVTLGFPHVTIRLVTAEPPAQVR